MVSIKKHDAWLRFTRAAQDVVIGRSVDDLLSFRRVAESEYPALLQVIDGYLHLMEVSATQVQDKENNTGRKPRSRSSSRQMHLFDLLREKTFFPQNLDLARFGGRIIPDLPTHRFDKMSRGDIAARIIEFLEGADVGTREALENSMREALDTMAGRPPKEVERRSFLSKWESIIKGADVVE